MENISEVADQLAKWINGRPMYLIADVKLNHIHLIPVDVYDADNCYAQTLPSPTSSITTFSEITDLANRIEGCPMIFSFNKETYHIRMIPAY